MVLSCSPTGLGGWNVDVSRPLASSARSPHSVSAGNASVPALTTVISVVPSLKKYKLGCARLPAWGAWARAGAEVASAAAPTAPDPALRPTRRAITTMTVFHYVLPNQ